MSNAGGVMHVSAALQCTMHLFGPWREGSEPHKRLIEQQNHKLAQPVSCDKV